MPDRLRGGILIVGSIPFAFDIDARWELAGEQSEAAALLKVLREDFVSTAAEAEAEAALAQGRVRSDWLIATDHVGAGFDDLPCTPRPTQAWTHPESADLRGPLASIWLSLTFRAHAA